MKMIRQKSHRMIKGRVVVVVVAGMQVLVILFAQSRTKGHFCLVFPVVFLVVLKIRTINPVQDALMRMSQQAYMDKSTRTLKRIGSKTFSARNQVCSFKNLLSIFFLVPFPYYSLIILYSHSKRKHLPRLWR